MKKKYIVNLSDTQRQMLRDCVEKGKTTAYKIRHAHILLKADAEGSGWSDAEITEAFGCHPQTVYNVRRRFLEKGFSDEQQVCGFYTRCFPQSVFRTSLDGTQRRRLRISQNQ